MSDNNDEETNRPFIFKFKDISISFPFKIYDIQQNYMRQMIRALEEVN